MKLKLKNQLNEEYSRKNRKKTELMVEFKYKKEELCHG